MALLDDEAALLARVGDGHRVEAGLERAHEPALVAERDLSGRADGRRQRSARGRRGRASMLLFEPIRSDCDEPFPDRAARDRARRDHRGPRCRGREHELGDRRLVEIGGGVGRAGLERRAEHAVVLVAVLQRGRDADAGAGELELDEALARRHVVDPGEVDVGEDDRRRDLNLVGAGRDRADRLAAVVGDPERAVHVVAHVERREAACSPCLHSRSAVPPQRRQERRSEPKNAWYEQPSGRPPSCHMSRKVGRACFQALPRLRRSRASGFT